jgi:hypothetical protein
LALGVGLCVAAVTGACHGDGFHRVGSIGDSGSAGAPDSEPGGAAGAIEPSGGTGGKQDAGTQETAGEAGMPDGAAGEAGSSGNPASPSCTNGIQDGSETDVDCGGNACTGCKTGGRCTVAHDCKSGTCKTGVCSAEAAASCEDGTRNGDETDVDCGGAVCAACAKGKTCVSEADCLSYVCDAGTCAAATCTDAVRNGDETDTDCGGDVCAKCEVGQSCLLPTDCVNSVCADGICAFARCNDEIKNGDETDIDCGGEQCPACEAGDACAVASDCVDSVCTGGICRSETCADGIKNGNETDVDCGGACGRCAPGLTCATAADCESSTCKENVCTDSTCQDDIENGDETDIDCGGPTCPACNEGKSCIVSADCDGGECGSGVCVPGEVASRQTVTFRVHNGAESERALQIGGDLCSAFAVYRLDGETPKLVNREVRYWTGVCQYVDYTTLSHLAWSAPGDTRELIWDAREERVVFQTVQCSDLVEDPAQETAQVPIGVARPAAPGDYQVEIAYFVGTPNEQDCFAEADGVRCVGGLTNAYQLGEICDISGLERMTVPFTLPKTGDVTVDIEIE